MKKLIVSLLASLGFITAAAASEGGFALDRFPQEKVTDVAALQHGAKLFVNYCLNCHSAAYMRFNRLRDIGLSDDQIKKNLLFPTDKVGDTMKVALDPRRQGVVRCHAARSDRDRALAGGPGRQRCEYGQVVPE